jgi:prepilin-type N-terminal cleavage/methylation domain-containing protein
MKVIGCRSGFSLVEVVIAIAVLAVSVAGVLALLPVVTRQTSEASESLVAHGLAGAVEVELDNLVRREGWTALVAKFPTSGSAAGLAFVGTKQGERIGAVETSTIPQTEQFFLIELWRLDPVASGAVEEDSASLAVQVRVAWPYRLATADGRSVETKPEVRASVQFLVSVRR